MVERSMTSELVNRIGNTVTVKGWIDRIRDHGGLIFIDVRDRDGIIQVVVDTVNTELSSTAKSLNNEDVVCITGILNKRSENLINEHIQTGTIEIMCEDIQIYSRSKTLPFQLHEDNIGEEIRLQYRYLDLRRPEMARRLKLRHEIIQYTRNWMTAKGFWEIETPILMKGTPEGSREYLVPSRLHQGNFYVLPQSPQQFKQILMVAGVEKYFQIARCFRDEDQRKDRQPEFTQLDIEMSFCTSEEILTLTESLIRELAIRYSHKKLLSTTFERMTFEEAMNSYGNDKPDLRIGMKIHDYTPYLSSVQAQFIQSICENGGSFKGIKVNNATWFSRKIYDELLEFMKQQGADGLLYVQFTTEGWTSPINKFLTNEVVLSMQKECSANPGDIVFLFGGQNNKILPMLSTLRKRVAEISGLYAAVKNQLAVCWVTDFPLFERDENTGELSAAHHPFTSPKFEDINLLDDPDSYTNIRSEAWDIVINGYELCSGSIRIHNKDLQSKIFDILGISKEDQKLRFGHLLQAFDYGVPPHGGIAPGIDRLITLLITDEENIRESIAFPKNNAARDIMSGAPSPMPKQQLKELGIELIS